MLSFQVTGTTQKQAKRKYDARYLWKGAVSYYIFFLYLGALNRLGRKQRINTILDKSKSKSYRDFRETDPWAVHYREFGEMVHFDWVKTCHIRKFFCKNGMKTVLKPRFPTILLKLVVCYQV